MSNRTLHNTAVIIAAAALSTLAVKTYVPSHEAASLSENRERCYGVAKANANDCATSLHSCAAQGRYDGDPTEWILLPKGLCERLVVKS